MCACGRPRFANCVELLLTTAFRQRLSPPAHPLPHLFRPNQTPKGPDSPYPVVDLELDHGAQRLFRGVELVLKGIAPRRRECVSLDRRRLLLPFKGDHRVRVAQAILVCVCARARACRVSTENNQIISKTVPRLKKKPKKQKYTAAANVLRRPFARFDFQRHQRGFVQAATQGH